MWVMPARANGGKPLAPQSLVPSPQSLFFFPHTPHTTYLCFHRHSRFVPSFLKNSFSLSFPRTDSLAARAHEVFRAFGPACHTFESRSEFAATLPPSVSGRP